MAEWYVAPWGKVGNKGTYYDPWDFGSAITGHSGAIQPSDTIWMHGGFYHQAAQWLVTVSGSVGGGFDDETGKIQFRNLPGHLCWFASTNAAAESLTFDCSYVWFRATLGYNEGIRVYRPVPERITTRGTNIWFRADPQNGNKLIHVVTHDGGNGVLSTNGAGTSAEYGDLELYGLISYNCGQDTAPRTHGLYIQHEQNANRDKFKATGCIVFNTLGHGIQAYSEIVNAMSDYEFRNCIVFNGGQLGTDTSTWTTFLHGVSAQPIRGCKVLDNVFYLPSSVPASAKLVTMGTAGVAGEDCEFGGNYMIGGQDTNNVSMRGFRTDGNPTLDFHDNFASRNGASPVRLVQVEPTGSLAQWGWDNNIWAGRTESQSAWRQVSTDKNWATFKTDTSLGNTDTVESADPTTNKVFVFPLTKYNLGYGHVCFFNWENTSTVGVDLSSILSPGDAYEVYNVQDVFGPPVIARVYGGGLVQFPTTGKEPPTPIGITPRLAPKTAPFFDAFFVRKVTILQRPRMKIVAPQQRVL